MNFLSPEGFCDFFLLFLLNLSWVFKVYCWFLLWIISIFCSLVLISYFVSSSSRIYSSTSDTLLLRLSKEVGSFDLFVLEWGVRGLLWIDICVNPSNSKGITIVVLGIESMLIICKSRILSLYTLKLPLLYLWTWYSIVSLLVAAF